jgi:hypothetical protein
MPYYFNPFWQFFNFSLPDMLKKLNMVIGTFFSEVGTELLQLISKNHKSNEIAKQFLQIETDWKESDYRQTVSLIKKFAPTSTTPKLTGRGYGIF